MSPSWSELTRKNSSPVEFSHDFIPTVGHRLQQPKKPVWRWTWRCFTAGTSAFFLSGRHFSAHRRMHAVLPFDQAPGEGAKTFGCPSWVKGVPLPLAVWKPNLTNSCFHKEAGPTTFGRWIFRYSWRVIKMKVVNVCCKICGRKIIPLPNCSPRSMLIIRLKHFWAWRCSLALRVEKLVVWQMFVSQSHGHSKLRQPNGSQQNCATT